MKRLLLVLAVAALAFPAAAVAKGPSEASITGPGLDNAIKISGPESEGSPMMDFAEAAGFFPAAFGQTPDPMMSGPPKSLGLKYAIVYTVPGGDGDTFTIHQDLYPYAQPNGVTYMPPGQKIFDMTTHGGWFTDARLKEILLAKGLPKTQSDAKAASNSAGFFSTGRLGVLALVVLLLAGGFVLMRRHPRHDAA
jgi:hypothetical protein